MKEDKITHYSIISVFQYSNVAEVVTNAMREYAEDVRQGKFPEEEHFYRMIKGEDEKFLKLMNDE